jgi:dipeptidyl aminopeptidase/acylaminoacyl peptidase
VWAVRADGLAATLVAAAGRTPMWAPDGSKIAFAATGIWIANPNGTSPQQLSTSADDNAPAWSPDSTRLAYGHNGLNGELWVVNRDGTGRRRLLANALSAAPLPRWAPGRSIALGDDEEEEPTALPGIRLVAPGDGSIARIAPARRSPVVIRNAVSGRLIRAFTIDGHAYAIALGPNYVAMLVRHDAVTRLELWSFRGTTPRAASVPAGARDLSAAGRNVVFAAGRVIFRMRSNTGVVDAIAKRRIPPRSPVVEGRRLAWAENRGNRAWIRAMTLSR